MSTPETITIPQTVEAFWQRVDALEAMLRRQLPGLPFYDINQVADARRRAVLGWDGMRIKWERAVDPPARTVAAPLNAEELHQAMDGFQITAARMLAAHGLNPAAEAGPVPSA